jgi:hypothetical protein
MSNSTDPRGVTRWRSGGPPIEGLSEALTALSAARASDAELARLRAALAPQLSAPTRRALGGASPSALGWLSSTRVWPWLSMVMIGIATIWLLRSQSSEPALPSAPPARQSTVVRHVTADPPFGPSASVQPAAPASKPVRARSVSKRRAAAASQSPDKPLAPEAELALLQRAQSALNRSASAALELAAEHTRSYPNGLFAQEREMLCIEAELKLGKRREALTRAHAFAARFGRSTYRARIDRLLASYSALKDQEIVEPEGTQ